MARSYQSNSEDTSGLVVEPVTNRDHVTEQFLAWNGVSRRQSPEIETDVPDNAFARKVRAREPSTRDDAFVRPVRLDGTMDGKSF